MSWGIRGLGLKVTKKSAFFRTIRPGRAWNGKNNRIIYTQLIHNHNKKEILGGFLLDTSTH